MALKIIDLTALVLRFPAFRSVASTLTVHWGAGGKSGASVLNFCILVECSDFVWKASYRSGVKVWAWHAALWKSPVKFSFLNSQRYWLGRLPVCVFGILCVCVWCVVFIGALLSRELRIFDSRGLIMTSICLSGHVLMSRLRLISEINSTRW